MAHTIKNGSGFTLLQLMMSLAIIAIIATIAVSGFSRFARNAEVTAAAESGASLLQDARSKTLSSENAAQYGVHFDTDRLMRFTGASYVAGNATNVEVILSPGIRISTITLAGGGSDVVFKRLTGSTDQSGSVRISSTADATYTKLIIILSTGIVHVQ